MIFGSVYDSINESTLGDVAPYEFDESMSFQEMGAQMIEEATQDWNNYMQAVALTELSYVIENHQEYIYEAVDISVMIDKVKDWFKKLWAKIQGIARAAIAKFMSWGHNDEGFIDKYKQDIEDGASKIPAGFSYKGYKFDNLSGKINVIKGTGANFVKEWAKDIGLFSNTQSNGWDANNDGKVKYDEKKYSQKNLNESLDKYRSTITGGSGKVSSGDFKKAIKKYLYGSLDKEYIKTVDTSSLMDIVKGCKEAISNAKEAESAIKEDIDGQIELLNDIESKAKSDNKEDGTTKEGRTTNNYWASLTSRVASHMRDVETANSTWFSAYITALKDQRCQAKAVCTKLISYANGVGGKKEPKNESASLLEGRFQELLDF